MNHQPETFPFDKEFSNFRECFLCSIALHSLQRKRYLVVADGFYEWKKEGTKKRPYFDLGLNISYKLSYVNLSNHFCW